MQLIDLTKDEHEFGFDQLALPVVEQVVDESLRENGILDLPEAVLYFDCSLDERIEGAVVCGCHELAGVAESLHLYPEAVELLRLRILENSMSLLDDGIEFFFDDHRRHLANPFYGKRRPGTHGERPFQEP